MRVSLLRSVGAATAASAARSAQDWDPRQPCRRPGNGWVVTRRLRPLLADGASGCRRAPQEKLTQRWQSVDAVVRDQIKQALLRVLTTSEAAEVRRGAAQAIAKVASIDMADGAWPDLMEFLMKFTSADAGVSAGVRTNTLEAIGYVCEELAVYDGDLLSEKETNDILNAVVKNIGETGEGRGRAAARGAWRDSCAVQARYVRLRTRRRPDRGDGHAGPEQRVDVRPEQFRAPA